ncbi:MAG TPA: type IV secretory system conjugative DNA transfer family protein [Candidatus Onthocola stercorigallinarum]|nr:type IV secretory system conjugative DNA transfer family protein [Candidatus Onthocola stercorigallinarum]
MKFKVEPKDFLLFCIYCGLLLYLCAIAVLNISSLTHEGTFYGLLPFEAFTGNYLPLTLILFIASLVAIFTSVSSYIFKREKGSHGIGILFKGKSSDGYSKWSTEKDIKSQPDVVKVIPQSDALDAAGIPLINNGKEMYVDNGEYHNLVIGSTGSGKTQTIVKPMVNLLAKKGESMIITDPKGEIYKYSANYLKKKGYKIIVLNFREPLRGNSWNPLTLPFKYYRSGNQDKAIELLDDVALNILYDPSNKSESDFWEKSSADYFSGLALGLFKDAKEEEVNLNSINAMSTVGEERYAMGSNYIKEYFTMKGETSNEYIFASSVINAPTDTKGGQLATFRQKIRKFSTGEALSEMLSYSDFDMRTIGDGKTAIFMIIHDEKKTYHSLMTIFIKQCYETLIDAAQENGGKLPVRTNFILDEFANMPPLKDVDAMVSAARSRDIRFTFIIQNFAQLNDVYGDNVAEIIKGNCGNIVYLISTEMKALEEISKMCGEVKVTDDKDKNATRPLISITDLQKMKLFEAIIIRLRMSPFRTKLEPDFKMDWGIERIEEPYPNRSQRKVEIFDLKKFVTEEKSKRMANMGDNQFRGQNPFRPNPSVAPNPFGGLGQTQSPNPGMGGMDIDSLLKDLDEKFKELDRKEAQKKQVVPNHLVDLGEEIDMPKKKIEPVSDGKVEKNDFNPFMNFNTNNDVTPKDDTKIEVDEIKEEPIVNESKPIINVDSDSKVIDDNVISDDEFFDDFFGDDDE